MDNDQTYTSPTNLPIRELSLPEKGWECEICGFQSAFKTSLINHQAVHSDARPFECPVCDYAAKRKYDLKKHIQLKHGREELVLNLSKDYTSQVESTNFYGGVTSTARSNCESSTSPIGDYSRSNRSERSEVINTSFDRSTTKITEVEHCDPGPEKRQSLYIKTEPCNREEEDEDANLGVSFPDAHQVQQCHETLAIGRETYGINARERLTKPRNIPSCDAKLHNATPSKSQVPVQSQAEHISFGRQSFDVSHIDTDSSSYKRRHLHDPNALFPKDKTIIRHSLYSADSEADGNHHQRKRIRRFSTHMDDPSSSMSSQSEMPTHSEVSCSSVKTDKQCQTKRTFACPHCGILYFDHALYLMHMGLHTSDNPWRCAICGADFWEKYSFTSHFINLHSQVTSGE